MTETIKAWHFVGDRLRALAQAATPWPWRVEAQGHAAQEVARVNNLEVAPPDSVELSHCATDAAYIAAVSPDVVLALLSDVERLTLLSRKSTVWRAIAKREGGRQMSPIVAIQYLRRRAAISAGTNSGATTRDATVLLLIADLIQQLAAENAELRRALKLSGQVTRNSIGEDEK